MAIEYCLPFILRQFRCVDVLSVRATCRRWREVVDCDMRILRDLATRLRYPVDAPPLLTMRACRTIEYYLDFIVDSVMARGDVGTIANGFLQGGDNGFLDAVTRLGAEQRFGNIAEELSNDMMVRRAVNKTKRRRVEYCRAELRPSHRAQHPIMSEMSAMSCDITSLLDSSVILACISVARQICFARLGNRERPTIDELATAVAHNYPSVAIHTAVLQTHYRLRAFNHHTQYVRVRRDRSLVPNNVSRPASIVTLVVEGNIPQIDDMFRATELLAPFGAIYEPRTFAAIKIPCPHLGAMLAFSSKRCVIVGTHSTIEARTAHAHITQLLYLATGQREMAQPELSIRNIVAFGHMGRPIDLGRLIETLNDRANYDPHRAPELNINLDDFNDGKSIAKIYPTGRYCLARFRVERDIALADERVRAVIERSQ